MARAEVVQMVTAPVAVHVLGSVRLVVGNRAVPLTAQQRIVLGLLATAGGRRRSVPALRAALWGDAPPASGLNALRVLVRSIRRLSAAPVIVTADRAYELAAGVGVDLDAVQVAMRDTVAAARAGDDLAALERYAEGRGSITGTPFADVPSELFELQRDAVEELLLEGLEHATDACIRHGSTALVLEELLLVAAAHPLRESLQERLVRALLASGRRAEALEA